MPFDNDTAISAEGLAKAYTISHNVSHDSVRDLITYKLKRNRTSRVDPAPGRETFWALKDVSFDIQRGESVGIIGRNGAGKSTLLKVLSRVTEPTSGKAILRGRLGSLLEVGTGFHQELTGSENIYLNGTILGMTRSEIRSQFDSIVDFAGTEKFLDTPVKRYSSGMYVRLAFAIAAHLNPEIMIIDEVLAVGDAEFQKKCMGKMQDVNSQGRTVIFVSHTISSVLQLCKRCIYLKNGMIQADGSAVEVANIYQSDGKKNLTSATWTPEDAPGNELARILGVRVLGEGDIAPENLTISTPITLEMEFEVLLAGIELSVAFHLFNSRTVCVFSNPNSTNVEWINKTYSTGIYKARCEIPANYLNDDTYNVTPIVLRGISDILFEVRDAVQFELHDDGSGRGNYTGGVQGVLRPSLLWEFEQCTAES